MKEMQDYSLIHQPNGEPRLGDILNENLTKRKWTNFQAAIAFVKYSGVKHLANSLKKFLDHGHVRISVGIDHAGSSVEGLEALIKILGSKGEVFVFHNESPSTFHPKIYLFSNEENAECVIGSGNLTEGGLYTNYEVSVHLKLDRRNKECSNFLNLVEEILSRWSNTALGTICQLTPKIIKRLQESGKVLTEIQIKEETRNALSTEIKSNIVEEERLFSAEPVRPAPRIPTETKAVTIGKETLLEIGTGKIQGFLMTLQRTDVGVGQTTPGTSKRSPEIFIPLVARDENPEFWGWPSLFREDLNKPGKYDRWGVKMRLAGRIVEVNMMTWPDKHDFRLRASAIRDAGEVGDILHIEIAGENAGFEYSVEIIPYGTNDYVRYFSRCVNKARNSKKRWGYY